MMPLGKRRARLGDPENRVRLSAYLSPGLVVPVLPPEVTAWKRVTAWGEYGNRTLGTCGVAAPANLVRLWSAETGAEKDLGDASVLEAYAVVSGFDPARPGETDFGCVLTDVFRLWSSQGAGGIGGDVIDAFAAVSFRNELHLKLAIALLGGVVLGLQLPVAVQQAPAWDVPPNAEGDALWRRDSWGGHAVAVVGYDTEGYTVISWGQPRRMTSAFLLAYADEAWGAVSGPDWTTRAAGQLAAVSPAGLDVAALKRDLAALA